MTEKVGWTQVTVAMKWQCFTPAQWVGLIFLLLRCHVVMQTMQHYCIQGATELLQQKGFWPFEFLRLDGTLFCIKIFMYGNLDIWWPGQGILPRGSMKYHFSPYVFKFVPIPCVYLC